MSEDQANSASVGDEINQDGSFGVGVNKGVVNNNFYNSSTEKLAQQFPQKISPQSIAEFLQAIEKQFQHMKLFHLPQEKVLLKDQYIPIQVTLERRYKHKIENIGEYAESEEDLQHIYALKGMNWQEISNKQVDWEVAKKKHQRLMVLADPGMGKSTLLRMEALELNYFCMAQNSCANF